MKDNLLKPLATFFILLICAISLARVSMPPTQEKANLPQKQSTATKTAASYRPYKDPKTLNVPINWRKPSQSIPYPKVKRLENDLTIRVSLKGNRVYILRDNHVVYTMVSSAGKYHNGKSYTPTGTFKIQSNRGSSFYNPKLNEGANYWTSFDTDNVCLFHSVPVKTNGKYNKKEAKKLGVTPSSHGCIRLSVPDAYWIMKHVPANTEVIIKNN